MYGISRKTGYKWLSRFEADGEAGLLERSRAPHHQPHRVAEDIESAVVAVREKHSTWGPKKVYVELCKEFDSSLLPSRTTIANVLARQGLSEPRRVKRHASASEQPLAHAVESNLVWCIDFKGWFRTVDVCRIDPLTITDAYSRYLVCLQSMRGKTDTTHVMALMKTAFRAYGLPERIRSDNGSPFASTGLAGLTRLSVWWMQLGIVAERIEPGKPQQNGRHERFHRTLKQETASPPASTFNRQQKRFRQFRHEYNELRPHEALGQIPPAAVYQPSPRCLPCKLAPIEYPDDMHVRRVRGCGQMKWDGHDVHVSQALVGHPVGLLPLDDGIWTVYFSSTPLGVFDERTMHVYAGTHAIPKRKKGRR